mmetsp:Transcript_60725/g.162543  ORF Transcript_60725/g.162543 Transcript_60725/m.162543 type:complete len:235 (-) Transcript_60725:370-1074(-)
MPERQSKQKSMNIAGRAALPPFFPLRSTSTISPLESSSMVSVFVQSSGLQLLTWLTTPSHSPWRSWSSCSTCCFRVRFVVQALEQLDHSDQGPHSHVTGQWITNCMSRLLSPSELQFHCCTRRPFDVSPSGTSRHFPLWFAGCIRPCEAFGTVKRMFSLGASEHFQNCSRLVLPGASRQYSGSEASLMGPKPPAGTMNLSFTLAQSHIWSFMPFCVPWGLTTSQHLSGCCAQAM